MNSQAPEFCRACIDGDISKVTLLIKQEPLLANAYGLVHPEHVEKMKLSGAECGWSALHLATHYGRLEVVKILVESGADINAKANNRIGNTPLMSAIASNQFEVAKLLLEKGANPHTKDKSNLNALKLAEVNKKPQMTKLIQKYM